MESKKLREIANTTAETLQSYLQDTENWKTSKKTKEVLVEAKHSAIPGNEHGHIYRAQCELSCSKDILHKYMYPVGGALSEIRRKWDKDVSDILLLERIAPDLTINLVRTNSAAMGVIYPREFLDLFFELQTDNCLSFNGVSIDYPSQLPNPKFVRGWNHPSGFFCQDIPGRPGHTKLVIIVQTDIKGNLPRSLVDSAIPGAVVGLCHNLRNMLKKDGHIPR
ncbi:StAR-related lipid transfer protein 5 [Elysia marginata]|uniref:StAR-related lipid transfer protein 5 n=1 Tax=Elysia marginata TaxID=1093978 RepID=A0AAV4FQB0_9GAST|nr:StAR-related lipid transfer protein 5 [Elysia marginata]